MKFKSYLALILFLGIFKTGLVVGLEDFAGIPKLMVRGEARMRKPADELVIQLGVVTQGSLATQALKENNQQMQGIIQNLIDIGLKESDYSTGRFSIQPVYSVPPHNPPPHWKPTIEGYEVNNTLTIRTEQLTLAGSIIDAASQAGANSIDSIDFHLQDPNLYREEAIKAATEVALNEATILAQAAHLKLVRILSIVLNDAQFEPMTKNAPMMMRAAAFEATPTPIKAGDIEISAHVDILFELQ
jgi:uncharacterized protein YggE